MINGDDRCRFCDGATLTDPSSVCCMQSESLYLESVNLQIHDMVMSDTMSAKTHLFVLKTMGLPSPA